MSGTDVYVYPGTRVLKNKFECHDAADLMTLETLSTGGNIAYLQQHPIEGCFDFAHLKEIHRFIFQDVYSWAGEVRTVDIGKNNLFCRAQFINDYAETVFNGLYENCKKAKKNKSSFVKTLVPYFADINALHPFREGNGRTQREFVRELCLKCGYVLDLTKTTHHEMLDASIASFNTGDNGKLLDIFERAVIPVKEYENIKERLNSFLFTLSQDDG